MHIKHKTIKLFRTFKLYVCVCVCTYTYIYSVFIYVFHIYDIYTLLYKSVLSVYAHIIIYIFRWFSRLNGCQKSVSARSFTSYLILLWCTVAYPVALLCAQYWSCADVCSDSCRCSWADESGLSSAYSSVSLGRSDTNWTLLCCTECVGAVWGDVYCDGGFWYEDYF